MPRNILPHIVIRPRVYYYHPRYLHRPRALYGEPVATSEVQCSRLRSSTTQPTVPSSHVFVQSSTYHTMITPVSYPFPVMNDSLTYSQTIQLRPSSGITRTYL